MADRGSDTADTPPATSEDQADTVPDATEDRFFGGRASFFLGNSGLRPTPTNDTEHRWHPTIYSAFSISGLDTPASSVEEKDAGTGLSARNIAILQREEVEVQLNDEQRPSPLALGTPAKTLTRVDPESESEAQGVHRAVARDIGVTKASKESRVDGPLLKPKPNRVHFRDTAPTGVSGGSRASSRKSIESRPPLELPGGHAAPVGPMLQPPPNLPKGAECDYHTRNGYLVVISTVIPGAWREHAQGWARSCSLICL